MADIGADALVTSISSAGFMSGVPGVVQGAIHSMPVDTLINDPASGIQKMSEAGIQGAVNNIPYAGPALSAFNDAMRLSEKYFGNEPDYSDQYYLRHNYHEYNSATKKKVDVVRDRHKKSKLRYLKKKLVNIIDDKHESNKAPDETYPLLLDRNSISSSNDIEAYGHLWSITLSKWGQYSIENPYASKTVKYLGPNGLILPSNLLPATSFRYDTYKVDNEQLTLCPGCSIEIPSGYNYNKSITVSLFNDNQNSVREYLRAYKRSVIPGFQIVRPYKDCCSKLVLRIYNRQGYLMYAYELWVIPDLNDDSVSDKADTSMDITFNILGESDTNVAT